MTISSIPTGGIRPPGMIGLVGFFTFGACVSLITAIALLDPQGPLEPVWQLKPEARGQFQAMGAWAVPLMTAIFVACSLAALGLWNRRPWGRRLALGILTVNLVGDSANALVRHDWLTLIGLPIGGALIVYLLSSRVKSLFHPHPSG